MSRRSTYLASLPSAAPGHLSDLLDSVPRPDASSLIESLGWSPPEADRLLRHLGTDEIPEILELADFQAAAAAHREEQRALLEEYLRATLPLDEEPVCLVDVGWKGTMQDQLQAILPETHLRGLYLGLVAQRSLKEEGAKEGLLFHNRPEPSRHLGVFGQFKGLFEVLLTAYHGSVRRYARRGDEVVPILEDVPEEQDTHVRLVAPLQARIRPAVRRGRLRPFPQRTGRRGAAGHRGPTPRRHDLRAELGRDRAHPRDRLLRWLRAASASADPGAVRKAAGATGGARLASPLELVRGGGWPPLRLRLGGWDWLRRPYGLVQDRAVSAQVSIILLTAALAGRPPGKWM